MSGMAQTPQRVLRDRMLGILGSQPSASLNAPKYSPPLMPCTTTPGPAMTYRHHQADGSKQAGEIGQASHGRTWSAMAYCKIARTAYGR